MSVRLACFAVLFTVLSGCGFGRYIVFNPERDRVLRVESGDRFYFSLPEEDPRGGRWMAVSDDPDVEILIDHEDGEANVRIRIHRGYDGPSTLTFRRIRPGIRNPDRSFVLTLYRHTGDSAFWE